MCAAVANFSLVTLCPDGRGTPCWNFNNGTDNYLIGFAATCELQSTHCAGFLTNLGHQVGQGWTFTSRWLVGWEGVLGITWFQDETVAKRPIEHTLGGRFGTAGTTHFRSFWGVDPSTLPAKLDFTGGKEMETSDGRRIRPVLPLDSDRIPNLCGTHGMLPSLATFSLTFGRIDPINFS
jgi:hypothetical protein